MKNLDIISCPRCGSYRLRGEVRSNKPDLSLSGQIRNVKRSMSEIFSLGMIGSTIEELRRVFSRFRPSKVWVCCDCGHEFPMK